MTTKARLLSPEGVNVQEVIVEGFPRSIEMAIPNADAFKFAPDLEISEPWEPAGRFPYYIVRYLFEQVTGDGYHIYRQELNLK